MKAISINNPVRSSEYSGNQNIVINEGDIGVTPKEGNVTTENNNTLNVGEKAVIDAIEKANKIMINNNTRAEFSVHEKTKAIMVKIVDTDTNKVVKEFPPEKILDLVAKMIDMAGLFVDERR